MYICIYGDIYIYIYIYIYQHSFERLLAIVLGIALDFGYSKRNLFVDRMYSIVALSMQTFLTSPTLSLPKSEV